jgi:hypothetical protein
MNRRAVIKNLALIFGGTVILPSCLKRDNKVAVHLKHMDLSGDQQEMIADVCETIIPKTNTPGAKDLNVHLFVMKMLDDCYTKKDQQAFVIGMGQFDDMVKKKYGKSFSDLEVKDREDALNNLEKDIKTASNPAKSIKPVGNSQKSLPAPEKKQDIPPLHLFYSATKQQTIFGYTNSQYFMTKQIVYELIPGRYNAHFPVKNPKTA